MEAIASTALPSKLNSSLTLLTAKPVILASWAVNSLVPEMESTFLIASLIARAALLKAIS